MQNPKPTQNSRFNIRNYLWRVPVGLQLSVIYTLLLAGVLALLGLALYSQLDSFLIKDTSERLGRLTRPALAQPFPTEGGQAGASAGAPSPSPLATPGSVPGAPGERGPRSDLGALAQRRQFSPEQVANYLVRGLSTSDVAVAVLDAQGKVISSTQQSLLGANAPYIPPLPADWQSKSTNGSSGSGGSDGSGNGGTAQAAQWVADDSIHERQLVVLTPFTIPANAKYPQAQIYLEQVASLGAADAVLNQLRIYLGVGTLVGTLLGVLAGLWLTRVVLKPLDRMAGTAEAISAGDLGRRLRLPPGSNEVARLGHAFDCMVERLASALEAQRRFVADASHELRTPLTSLEGLSEMLLMGADRGDTRVVQRTVRSMHKELARLSRLVTDLLTLSHLDSAVPVHLVQVDVCHLLTEVAEQLRPQTEGQGVCLAVRCEGAPTVRAEPDKIKQVALNLVDNALRYTPPGGEVRLSATSAGHGETGMGMGVGVGHSHIQIEVQDTGPGIAPEDLPHVFDRFYRGDTSRARATGNSGLGLAIAQGIVQSYDGVITVESAPGKGAHFTVVLPGQLEIRN